LPEHDPVRLPPGFDTTRIKLGAGKRLASRNLDAIGGVDDLTTTDVRVHDRVRDRLALRSRPGSASSG
jgi:hypothetical protein